MERIISFINGLWDFMTYRDGLHLRRRGGRWVRLPTSDLWKY